jgi:hypothetical protein
MSILLEGLTCRCCKHKMIGRRRLETRYVCLRRGRRPNDPTLRHPFRGGMGALM